MKTTPIKINMMAMIPIFKSIKPDPPGTDRITGGDSQSNSRCWEFQSIGFTLTAEAHQRRRLTVLGRR